MNRDFALRLAVGAAYLWWHGVSVGALVAFFAGMGLMEYATRRLRAEREARR